MSGLIVVLAKIWIESESYLKQNLDYKSYSNRNLDYESYSNGNLKYVPVLVKRNVAVDCVDGGVTVAFLNVPSTFLVQLWYLFASFSLRETQNNLERNIFEKFW